MDRLGMEPTNEAVSKCLYNLDLENFFVESFSCFSDERVPTSHLFHTCYGVVFSTTHKEMTDVWETSVLRFDIV